MALYEFDENNIVKSSAVDKNGYHRDGGNVFVEDLFLMYGRPDSYVTGGTFWITSIIDSALHHEETGNNYLLGRCYLYFGDPIDNFDFQFDLANGVGSMPIITNYEYYNLLSSNTSNTTVIKYPYRFMRASYITSNTALPENWKELKAHIIVSFEKLDDNGAHFENSVFGYFQIHQR